LPQVSKGWSSIRSERPGRRWAPVQPRSGYALLPHIKITDLLLEVDHWTGFSKHFTHLKSGEPAKDHILLLTAILADGINLGISRLSILLMPVLP